MPNPTNDELVSEWLEWFEHNKGRAAGTVNKYLAYVGGLSRWLGERGKSLLQAGRTDLEEYVGIEAHRRGMRPRSRRPLVAAIKGFYRWAHRQRYVTDDPASRLGYPASGARLPKGMALHYAERLLMEPGMGDLKAVRDTAIISVLIGCGLRVGGLVALDQEDLIFTAVDDEERLVIRVVEKGDRERFVPAPTETMLLLRAYLGHPDLRQVDRTLPDGRQVLFVSMNNTKVPAHEYYGENTRLTEWSVHKLIVTYGERAGIPRDQCHPHALRHLYGTELTEGDIQQRKIQVLMGHASQKSTAIYQHVAMRSLVQAVDSANPLAKIETPVTGLAKHLKTGRRRS